jgi:hypothetical protein
VRSTKLVEDLEIVIDILTIAIAIIGKITVAAKLNVSLERIFIKNSLNNRKCSHNITENDTETKPK